MVTRIHKDAKTPLFIKEWMDHLGLTDEKIAGRLDVARETVWRWRTQQHRLNPQKLAALAGAMGIHPEDFWRPPSRPSADSLLREESTETAQRAVQLIEVMVGKRA